MSSSVEEIKEMFSFLLKDEHFKDISHYGEKYVTFYFSFIHYRYDAFGYISVPRLHTENLNWKYFVYESFDYEHQITNLEETETWFEEKVNETKEVLHKRDRFLKLGKRKSE